jgi:hypothetical protein
MDHAAFGKEPTSMAARERGGLDGLLFHAVPCAMRVVRDKDDAVREKVSASGMRT